MDMPILEETARGESESVLPGCPECGQALVVTGALLVTQVLECEGCGVELEVMALSPLVLALAPEVEEDWGE
jgi:alpha-aminoadipate carrier protein LysW